MRSHSIPTLFFGLLLAGTSAFGQYKLDTAGPPPSDLAPAIAQALQADGAKITNNGKAYCELWFRKQKPSGGTKEEGATMSLPPGAVLGVIRFDGLGSDRRGQGIKAGVYILRYALIPVNGDHQGVAPQRDFLVLSPASTDKDLSSTPAFDALMEMSRKASGTPHPAVLSFSKADADTLGLTQQGEDWVLQTKLGDTTIAIIVVGIASS